MEWKRLLKQRIEHGVKIHQKNTENNNEVKNEKQVEQAMERVVEEVEQVVDKVVDKVVDEVVERVYKHKSKFDVIAKHVKARKKRVDMQTLEWGRERNAGFKIGRIWYPVPMFFTADGHNVKLEDMARGASVILAGPDSRIKENGVIYVDNQNAGFINIITKDYGNRKCYDILNRVNTIKLMPTEFARLRRSDNKLVSHSPNCFYFVRSDTFKPDQFYTEDAFCNAGDGSGLSASIKLLYVMGYRRIFIDGFTIQSNAKNNLNIICRKAEELGLELRKIVSELRSNKGISIDIPQITINEANKIVNG